jgi:hypothetical protein
MEHVVLAAVSAGTFDGEDVQRLFDDADDRVIPPVIGAIEARVRFGDVHAYGAQADTALYIADGIDERLGLVLAGAEDVVSQALRGLGADARQTVERLDEALDWLRSGGGFSHAKAWP